MANIIDTHSIAVPTFGFKKPTDGSTYMTGIVLTVLTKGMSGRDCAAYQAIVRDTSREFSYVEAYKDEVAAGGNKITKAEAEKLFDLGDLNYRGRTV